MLRNCIFLPCSPRDLFLLPLLLLLGLSATDTYAQGKIAGRVTDATNGDPLIGVNVILEETSQGTVTDENGDYIILNVRPGTYTVIFSYIGFQTQRVTDIRATTGQTTRYDIEMREEVIEGEEIIVQAERPLVQKDLTASRKTVVAEEIEALPVEGFFGVLVTQAGVNQGPGGEIHIRGGRSNEVAYLVDGLSVGNPFSTNGLATSVAADAIQEMTVISGAFNAEYGKAMSGIVNLVTKEGADQLEGSVSFYGGDTFTRHGDIFFNPDNRALNVYTLEASLSGPLPFLRKVKFFASFRRDEDNGHIYGIREHLPSDSLNFNLSSAEEAALLATIRQFIPDYDGPVEYYELHGHPWWEYAATENPRPMPSERVAMNPAEGTNFIGKLTTRPFSGTKVEYSFLLDRGSRTPFNFSYRFNPDGVASTRDRSVNQSLHWTHTLNERAFYTLRASYQNHRVSTKLYDVELCSDAERANGCVDQIDPRYVSSNRTRSFPGTNFLFGNNQKGHVYEASRSWRYKFDLTNQFGTIHEAKIGAELNLHRLDRRNFVILYDGNTYTSPTILPPAESPSHDFYEDQKVTEFSAYAQDKLEFEDFIINVGLRYEHFNPHGEHILNDLKPKGERGKASTSNYFLPRIGVSFPITDTGIIHFSYGHFAQMPTLRNMYVNPEFEFPANAAPTFGNTDLRAERSVQYEIGLQQQLTDNLAFDVTGFAKDIRDYLAAQTIRFSTISGEDLYTIYQNRNYANVKGVTFALIKRRPRDGFLSANLDYTFQVAEGNRTDANAFFFNVLSGRETELEVIPLSFDQRHILSTTVTVSRPGWGLSMIGQFSTGYPYTPVLIDQQIDILPNNGRKPNQLKLDMHLFKNFEVGNAGLRVFAKVFNVLDHLNERFVFNETGTASYSLSEQRNLHATWRPLYGLPGIKDIDEYDTRPHYYSAPREIRVGATLSF